MAYSRRNARSSTLPFGVPAPLTRPTDHAAFPLVKGRPAANELRFGAGRPARAPRPLKSANHDWRGIPEGVLDDDEPPPASQESLDDPFDERAFYAPARRKGRLRTPVTRALFAVVFGAILALFAHELMLVLRLGARPF